jgi:hypothetical protein
MNRYHVVCEIPEGVILDDRGEGCLSGHLISNEKGLKEISYDELIRLCKKHPKKATPIIDYFKLEV